MAQAVVVGGGFAGMSAAARLAKLRHDVTLLEASDQLGGQLLGACDGPHRWYDDPPTVTLPGVFRDLFRKSGRTLDRELDLAPVEPRRHLWADGTVLDLPFGSRAAQGEALRAALGADEWSPWLDTVADRWNLVRRRALDQVFDGAVDRELRAMLSARRSAASLAAGFTDPRLRRMALDPVTLAGDDPARTPAFALMGPYLERAFSRWRFEGGPAALAEVLVKRLEQRRVTIRAACAGVDIIRDGGRITGVATDAAPVPADVVVWCAPQSPASVPWRGLRLRAPAPRARLLLGPGARPGADDVMAHLPQGPARLFRGEGDAWTLAHPAGDPLSILAAIGVAADDVLACQPVAPADLAGHPGWAWRGWRTATRRPGVRPTGGLFLAGAHAHPGTGLELAGMATSAIAAAVGPA